MDEPPKKRMKMDAGDDGDLTAQVSDLLTEGEWIPRQDERDRTSFY